MLAAEFTNFVVTVPSSACASIAFSNENSNGGKPPDQFLTSASAPGWNSPSRHCAKASLKSASSMTLSYTGFGSKIPQNALVAVRALRISSLKRRRLTVTIRKLGSDASSRSWSQRLRC
jgi:hypothetical protein